MMADNVICTNCSKEMFVVVGTEVCPKCKVRGNLAWVDDSEPEIEASESQIVNYNDYDNIVCSTEESVN